MTTDYDESKFEEINPEFYLQDENPDEPPLDEELDELSQQFVNKLIDKMMDFLKVLVGHDLHPYQKPLARRIMESVIINDAEEITALAARQSGKSETVADTVVTLMILLPRLAKLYPELLGKFKDGVWVGLFAPTEGQAETLFGRAVTRLTSERALEILNDVEIDDKAARVGGVTRQIKLVNSGSSITMMTANPRAKIESKSFHLIVIDECFPYETPVLTSEGLVPIGHIVETSSHKQWVVATQEADSVVGWAHVKATYKTPRYNQLVRVDHEHGSIYSTANHPFIVNGEAVPAINLQQGAPLSVVPNAVKPYGTEVQESRYAGMFNSVRLKSLQLVGTLQEQQPYEQSQKQEENVCYSQEYGSQTARTRGEWERPDETTITSLKEIAEAVGSRVCLPYWREDSEVAALSLQDRHCECREEDCCGNRRVLPWDPKTASTGQTQNPVAIESRVVSVTVLQPGSPELNQFGDKADFVYTLEVESESHTYYANGTLVGNCQEADDFVVSKSIAPMLAYYAGTMVKTGTPTTYKNNFYRAIQMNRRRQTTRGARQNHFQWDWKEVIKYNKNYERSIRKEMLRIGEDSDEFQMSYCVSPETRILTADLRYIRADEVEPGMMLVGFDEERPGKGTHRRLKETEVLDVGRIMRPAYKLTFDDGTVVTSSSEHRWLTNTAGGRTEWTTTEYLEIGFDRVVKVADVWEHSEDYRTGYLAAAFEGEGHFSRQQMLGFSQRENVMHYKVKQYLEELGFSTWSRNGSGTNGDVTITHIAGGRSEIMRFLGEVRPERLLQKLDINKLGTIGHHGRDGVKHPLLVSKEFLGEIEVIPIKTTSKTYIAEGLASHNCCKWLLERGMFITSTKMDDLGDTSQELVKSWHKTPCVVGIDPARKTDSTVVTVVWVDWDRPDEFGYFDHRILNWLEIQGDDWEEQYFQIVNFLENYDVLAVGVDANGVGDAVAQRLKLLLPRAEVMSLTSSPSEQSKRWKHLQALIQRDMISWPAHAKTRRLRTWKRFYQQMTDAEITFKGPNFLVAAPDEAYSHDDFVDSLGIAVSLTQDLVMPEVVVSTNNFYS